MVVNRETCKISDFGLLREIPKDNTIYQATTELPWPIRWMAPESLDNREFSPATDVWSFGVLLWEMYYPNQLPYTELNSVQVLSKVLSGHRLPIPPNYPPTVARIMKACWQREPEKRPSFLLISQTLLTS
jgi:serine/threonine protein kinase